MFTSPLLLSTFTRLPEPLSPDPRLPSRETSLFPSRDPSFLTSRFEVRSVLRFVLRSVDLFVLRFDSRLVVFLSAFDGVDTFRFDDFWCPPLIVCRDELLGLEEAWLVEACLEDVFREVDAFLLDALLLDPPLFAELALLEGALALLADAPPREA